MIDDVFDLLDHAVEPDPWECDGDWEYRAMHWRPSSRTSRASTTAAGTAVGSGPGPVTDPG